MCFLGKKEGYPFINPVLLLGCDINKKVFFLSDNFKKKQNNFCEKFLKNYKILFLTPLNCFDKNLTSCRVGQHIYHELANLNLEKYKHKFKNVIIVGPETTYPFFLNKNLDQIKLWDSVLPENAYLMFGSQRFSTKSIQKQQGEWYENNKVFQTVYIIHQGRIINFYDKKHCVQFTEKTPKFIKNLKITKEILKNKLEFSKSKLKKFKAFKISKDLKIIPIICSEFFFLNLNEIKKIKKKNINKNLIILLFVNDSWFMPYFKKLMKNFVIFTSYKLNLPILYVGWPEKI
ncbi:hypothetical protein K9L05_00475 [Candidatus Babeliales bacterium]|nr:hypothetical protein [Candidatus Babeliales bacterium]MCF7899108.1 hypothetical protein [Candidatus Babeliales bacterium]